MGGKYTNLVSNEEKCIFKEVREREGKYDQNILQKFSNI